MCVTGKNSLAFSCALGAHLLPMKRTNIHLPDQIRSGLQAKADQRGIKVAELVRQILHSWLTRQEKKQ